MKEEREAERMFDTERTQAQTAEEIRAITPPLLSWYRENRRVLPWRSDPTPYHVWVSEIMLQQTRVAAVMGYYARFMEAFPDVKALAEADEDTLMKLWQGLGYYNRARNLQKAAKVVMEKSGGCFPDTYEDILSLPGVGEYTAGAIASIAFGIPVPCVDGNVLRVLTRVTGDDGDITKNETKAFLREALLAAMPKDAPGQFNQALMELGALVCVPNGAPVCEACPLKEHCFARIEDCADALPVKSVKAPRKIEERKVYLVFKDGKVLLHRRAEKGLLAKLWEFPNVLNGEEAPVRMKKTAKGPEGKHIFTHIEWRMTSVTGEMDGETPPDCVWAGKDELETVYAVPNAFGAFTEEAGKRII